MGIDDDDWVVVEHGDWIDWWVGLGNPEPPNPARNDIMNVPELKG